MVSENEFREEITNSERLAKSRNSRKDFVNGSKVLMERF